MVEKGNASQGGATPALRPTRRPQQSDPFCGGKLETVGQHFKQGTVDEQGSILSVGEVIGGDMGRSTLPV
jgi:hypothetical protein